ncbi:HK97 family phage prohead protease [Limibaculum sp. FT325]|uniref:prohead protease/major capsid protein fusion protein n=1 Tax=Thermohalobaculum sediminis TaxID=2939436 RepID=UPI0020C0B7F8|nr:prohead protease/major capsid protein fusion protein [Limibaculum sediminis]MCL5779193.1 HK97 family phage prohead protease [Limibaculum sediminis]
MPRDRIDLPVLERAASLRAESADPESRRIEVVWTSGATVRRRRFFDDDFDEELVVGPGTVRIDRLNRGAPFLNSHDSRRLDAILGVVVEGSVRIEDGRGTALIRFSDRAEVEPVWRDIQAGIIRNVSVGYRVHRFEIEKRDGAPELWRAVDWEPMEISAVAIGADPGARVRAEEPGPELHPCTLIRCESPAAQRAAQPTRTTMPNDTPAGARADAPAHADAQTTETRTAAAAPAPTPAPQAPSAEEIRAEERRRTAEITNLCQRHGLDAAFSADLIGRGVALDDARAAILDRLAEQDSAAGRRSEPIAATARGGMESEAAYRDAVTEALLHRHAPGAYPLPDRAREFRGMSLIELAKDALDRRGTRTRGMSKLEAASAALAMRSGAGYHSTSDFPAILANVANKTLRDAYASTPRTFTAWARRATIADFKPVQRTQLGGAPDLHKVLESGEFTYGTIGEVKEVYALATYGRIVGITRQTLINDDLDAFTRIPAAFGASAADLESDIVYAILKQNPAMGDGTALFDAAHGNVGTASAITEAALAEAYRLFGKQRGIEERLVSILPRFLLVPPGRRSVEARKQVTATTPGSTAEVNTFAGRLDVVEEPRLIPETGEDPWFLAADPARIDTIEYAYLEGQQGVHTETRMGFEVDGIEIKARHDFASKAIDWRGLYRNAGAAAAA